MALGAAGLAGAGLLAVAEFTSLLSVHTSLRTGMVTTIQTGSHHSYALIPIAVLAALLSVAAWRAPHPLVLLAVGLLGLVALLIALLGDLPDAQASGLIGSPLAIASSSPEIGFYLETLGAVVLVIVSGAGWLLIGSRSDRQMRSGPTAD